jgi:DNA-binding transcriptional ArsR family regulator
VETAKSTPQISVTLDVDTMLSNARAATDFVKALAHENRLIVLCMLLEGEKSFAELLQVLHVVRQPTLSQQLARLRADGLVTARRNGGASIIRWRRVRCLK